MSQLSDNLPDSASLDSLFASKDLQRILANSLLDPLSEFLTRPAKNLRSELVELGYRLSMAKDPVRISDKVKNDLMKACRIVELIHNGSLIVDDIQDSSTIRRQRPALHIVHGIPLALNAGNWLYFWALSQLRDLNLPGDIQQEVTDDILSMMMKAHAGQALDVGTRIDLLPRKKVRQTCLASMELKTGTLMSLALRLGAGVAGVSWKRHELFHLGTSLGVLLQMNDDIGNFLADSQKKYEDLQLKRPGWIWAVASQYEDKHYEAFIESIDLLPDETLLRRWTRKNNFKQLLYSETETFRAVCEVSWASEWEKSHPVSFKILMKMNLLLEKCYV